MRPNVGDNLLTKEEVQTMLVATLEQERQKIIGKGKPKAKRLV